MSGVCCVFVIIFAFGAIIRRCGVHTLLVSFELVVAVEDDQHQKKKYIS